MNELRRIVHAFDEKEMALAVGKGHDDARGSYPTRGLSVGGYADFEKAIGAYYAYHFSACVAPGARLPDFEAKQRAKAILVEEYRRQGLTANNACADAIDGTNGGMRRILDLVCDGLKHESEYNYGEQVFDTYVAPNDFEAKVEIIRQLMAHFAAMLPPSIHAARPEAYAADYKPLVRAIVDALRNIGRAARR